MKIIERIEEWWRSFREWGTSTKTCKLTCPFCRTIITLPAEGLLLRDYASERIHIVAPGTIVPCPHCGRNLSDFLRSGGTALEFP